MQRTFTDNTDFSINKERDKCITHHHFDIGCRWGDVAPRSRVEFQNIIAFILRWRFRQHRYDNQYGCKPDLLESAKG